MNNKQDLLFELGTEELPPVALKTLSNALTEGFLQGLKNAGLNHGEVNTYASPRRLALWIKDCDTQQADRTEKRRGPAVQAAFDADGNPTKAAEGFARSCNTGVEKLGRLKTDKGEWLTFEMQRPGKAAMALLPEIADKALALLPIPKRMRWGESEAQFVRPVHWLVFLLGNQIVPCTLLGVQSGNHTRGHRFHHPEPIELPEPNNYQNLLRNTGKVIAHFGERRQIIHEQIQRAAEALGANAQIDPALLDEVTALNEWPQAITGSFEEKYLEVPAEALILTMKKNQKYFHLVDKEGKLLNHFITIANIDSPKPEIISEGNERVIRPRLADAMFFWQQDGKKRLSDHVDALKNVVFQQKLGSMYDKSQRVSELAAWIADKIGGDKDLARRAGMLSRCDLLTNMVGEFADMQGIMGRYQALRDGEPEALANALEEFYLPRYSGDKLPTSKTGIALSLADKIDTLSGIFGIGMKPTGDKDPFALRRAALGALRIMREHSLTLNIPELLDRAAKQLADRITEKSLPQQLEQFLWDRYKGICSEEGIPLTLFEAVAAVKPETVPDFDARILAVQAFMQLPESEALASANKRISNLLKKSTDTIPGQVQPELFQEDMEKVLYDQIAQQRQNLIPLLQQSRYTDILAELSTLKAPLDRFFDQVMVNVDQDSLRRNRLALLQQLKSLFLNVADIAHLS